MWGSRDGDGGITLAVRDQNVSYVPLIIAEEREREIPRTRCMSG